MLRVVEEERIEQIEVGRDLIGAVMRQDVRDSIGS